MYNMLEVNSPMLISPDGTVSFHGFGTISDDKMTNRNNDRSNNMKPKLKDSHKSYESLQELRQENV